MDNASGSEWDFFFLWALLCRCDTYFVIALLFRGQIDTEDFSETRFEWNMSHDDILSLCISQPRAYLLWNSSYVRKYMVVSFKPPRVNISVACSHQHPSSLLHTLNANVNNFSLASFCYAILLQS